MEGLAGSYKYPRMDLVDIICFRDVEGGWYVQGLQANFSVRVYIRIKSTTTTVGCSTGHSGRLAWVLWTSKAGSAVLLVIRKLGGRKEDRITFIEFERKLVDDTVVSDLSPRHRQKKRGLGRLGRCHEPQRSQTHMAFREGQ